MPIERLGVIAALVFQLVGFGMLYGRLEQRVTNIETVQAERGPIMHDIPIQLARLEVRIDLLVEELLRRRPQSSWTDWVP